MIQITYWFLIFFIFSILGYISEVIFCYVADGKITNRGFLHGPYCPIYGFGALLIIVLLNQYNNDPIALFILSVVFTSILEYFTSWLMEKVFNDRWWDYSSNFANINGRVCLFNSLCFGIGALLINYILFPLISRLVLLLNNHILIIVTSICFIGILTDFIITTNLAWKLKKQIELMKEFFGNRKINLPKIELFDKGLLKRLEKYKKIPQHFINAFPDIIKRNSIEIKALKDIYLKRNNKKKNK